jgi:signal transduction histidine kinase
MNTMLESFTRPPDLDNVEVGQTVLGAGLVAGTLPSLLLMTLDIDIIHNRPVYATLLAIYITLLLSLIVRTRITLWLWRHLWAYLLVLSLVCLAIQSQIAESFLQPIIFIPLLVQAALIYPPGRVALVALWLLGLMNLGILLGGQPYAPALLLPTFGYGTFMTFTYAFVQLSRQQLAARREAHRLAADLARQRDYLAQLAAITATLTRDLELATVLGQVAEAGRALAHAAWARVWLDDADDVAGMRLAAIAPPGHDAPAAPAVPATQSDGHLMLPLVFKDATIGMLELRSADGAPFASDSAALLQPFADAAAVAIENAQLYEQARLSATLAERNRLARELHDTIAQGLTAVTMQLEAAGRSFERDPARARARIGRAHELARDALEDVRRSVWTLAAPLVDGAGLSAALQELTSRFAERTGLAACYEHHGGTPALDHAAAAQVLRIVQEALQNVEKHAHAQRVQVLSESDAGGLRVQVRDDGVGFAPEAPVTGANGSGFGLLSLRERARLAGGTLQVESAPDAGTQITVTIAPAH